MRRSGIAAAITMALFALGTLTASAANGDSMPNGMPWRSPNKITSGTPIALGSIAQCPTPPDPGDTVVVQVFLSLGSSGGIGQIVSVNPDGTWSADVVFAFSGTLLRQTDITASCVELNGVGGMPYARYMTRPTQVFSQT
jgi:hypothetical protein